MLQHSDMFRANLIIFSELFNINKAHIKIYNTTTSTAHEAILYCYKEFCYISRYFMKKFLCI